MALRAAGLEDGGPGAESLDAIGLEYGVSRETVRRAKSRLLDAIQELADAEGQVGLSLSLTSSRPVTQSITDATSRALRRLLTMTGPLAWDEVLSAWARAGGKPPYSPLPTAITSMRSWVDEIGGFQLSPRSNDPSRVVISVQEPEPLDPLSRFLLVALRDKGEGVHRSAILDASASSGLKASTVATALSQHPAVIRLGGGRWALRGEKRSDASTGTIREPRARRRTRPATFGWNSDATLFIEFSVPRGPSPVVAVPTAIADLTNNRSFKVDTSSRQTQISIGNARMWGFGALASELGLASEARARVSLDLSNGTAVFEAAPSQKAEE